MRELLSWLLYLEQLGSWDGGVVMATLSKLNMEPMKQYT